MLKWNRHRIRCTAGVHVWAAGVGLLLASAPGFAQPAAPSQRTLSVSFSASAATPVQQHVYGINCELLWWPLPYTHPSFIARYQEAGRPIIRYPGGTPANYFNPLTGLLEERPGHERRAVNNARIRAKYGGKGHDYREFFRFVDTADAPYSLTLNLTTMTVEENIRWLEELAAQGIRPRYFEMGNELYYNEYKDLIGGPDAYVQRSARLAAVIRRLFPGARICAILPSDPYSKVEFLETDKRAGKDTGPYDRWRAALKRADFFDAVALHVYSEYGMPGNIKEADYWPFERAYRYAMAQQDAQLIPFLEAMRRAFPGKPIWMTEYHLGGWTASLRAYKLIEAYLGSLHSSAMLLKLAKHPAVEMANRHTFVAFMQWYDFDRITNGLIPDEAPMSPNAHFHQFRLIGEAIRAARTVVAPELPGAGTYAGAPPRRGPFPDVEAAVFLAGISGHIVLLNKMDTTYRLGAVAMDGRPVALGATVQQGPRADLPVAQVVNGTRLEEIVLAEWPSPPADFTLPPYSVTRIAFRANPQLQ